MKLKLIITMAVAGMIGMGVAGNQVLAIEGPSGLKMQKKTPPPPPTMPKFKAVVPSNPGAGPAAGGIGNLQMNTVAKCHPGFGLSDIHQNTNGAMDRFKCTSQIIECPHKSKVKNSNGSPANGQGIELVKIPVGAGDSNRFKIQYTCTYYWAQG